MGRPIQAPSEKRLIIPWSRDGVPWSSFISSFFFNSIALSFLFFIDQSGLMINGQEMHTFSDVLNHQPLFSLLLLLPPISLLHFYRVGLRWMNKTSLEWTAENLLIQHGPFPWLRPSKRISCKEISSLILYSYSPGYQDGAPLRRLRLQMRSDAGSEVILLDGLLEEDRVILENWIRMEEKHQTALKYENAA